jgi:hypothetical protein
MISKVKLNFVVDAMILVAFLAAAVSGLVLLIMPQGGYQGGRNPDFYRAVLLVNRSTWNDLHTWTSLAMIAGIGVHLILHWKWIVCTVRRYLRPSATQQSWDAQAKVCPVVVTER